VCWQNALICGGCYAGDVSHAPHRDGFAAKGVSSPSGEFLRGMWQAVFDRGTAGFKPERQGRADGGRTVDDTDCLSENAAVWRQIARAVSGFVHDFKGFKDEMNDQGLQQTEERMTMLDRKMNFAGAGTC